MRLLRDQLISLLAFHYLIWLVIQSYLGLLYKKDRQNIFLPLWIMPFKLSKKPLKGQKYSKEKTQTKPLLVPMEEMVIIIKLYQRKFPKDMNIIVQFLMKLDDC